MSSAQSNSSSAIQNTQKNSLFFPSSSLSDASVDQSSSNPHAHMKFHDSKNANPSSIFSNSEFSQVPPQPRTPGVRTNDEWQKLAFPGVSSAMHDTPDPDQHYKAAIAFCNNLDQKHLCKTCLKHIKIVHFENYLQFSDSLKEMLRVIENKSNKAFQDEQKVAVFNVWKANILDSLGMCTFCKMNKSDQDSLTSTQNHLEKNFNSNKNSTSTVSVVEIVKQFQNPPQPRLFDGPHQHVTLQKSFIPPSDRRNAPSQDHIETFPQYQPHPPFTPPVRRIGEHNKIINEHVRLLMTIEEVVNGLFSITDLSENTRQSIDFILTQLVSMKNHTKTFLEELISSKGHFPKIDQTQTSSTSKIQLDEQAHQKETTSTIQSSSTPVQSPTAPAESIASTQQGSSTEQKVVASPPLENESPTALKSETNKQSIPSQITPWSNSSFHIISSNKTSSTSTTSQPAINNNKPGSNKTPPAPKPYYKHEKVEQKTEQTETESPEPPLDVLPRVPPALTFAEKIQQDIENFEYNKTHPLFRTEKCVYFMQGSCARGDKCMFAHGKKQLRKPKDQ